MFIRRGKDPPVKIATWNVNSVRSRLERVAAWTERERPDVLCLQEIKTTDDLFPLEPFAELGYHAEVFGQKTYNGVAILSLKPVTKVVRNLPDDEPGAPSRLIAARSAGCGSSTSTCPTASRRRATSSSTRWTG